jgi:hypothetical protein
MSRKKLKNGERWVKPFRLNKSIVVVIPRDFLEEPTMLRQILVDKNNLLLKRVEKNE